MKFLIPTEPDDTHALVVKLALENSGHQATTIFTADQPTRQKNSIFVDDSTYRWQSADRYDMILENDYDVVWWRRPRKPYLPKGISHPDDYNFIIRENSLFYESFTYNFAPHAWWVNSKEAANRANFKLLQLKIASECGMIIPTTLCSNDPNEIKTFLLKYQKDGVIYKSLCANCWVSPDEIKFNYTSHIHYLDLPNNESLQRTPGIFQKEIKKKYELRITCFGNYIIAAKLDSQQHQDGTLDWRVLQNKNIQLNIEPYILPETLKTNIRQFMHEMGIVFGSFDFIVTEDNQYVFLEVNEQGQFLWLETYNEDFKMLDMFVNFLTSKSINFTWDPRQHTHNLDDYTIAAQTILEDNLKKHINLNQKTINKDIYESTV